MSALKKNKVVRELNAPASRRPSFYNRFLAPIKQSFWALPILGTLLTAQPALSQLTPRNPLNTRYAQGDIRTIGNTLMTCVPTQGFPGTCDPSRNDLPNNGINMQYVNVDPDPSFTVNNSSSARLNIPGLGTGAQSNVLWAGLYWHGRTTLSEARRAQVRIKPPGGTYRQITGNVVSGGSGNQYYQGFVEVTDLVRNGGDGTYTVGDVAADTGDNREAGWSLAVIYRDPNLPYRKLLVYDTNGAGTLTTVATQTTRQVELSLLEFRTPEANPDGSFQRFTAKLGMVVYDGDGGPGRGTDRVSLNGTVLSTAQNPPDDFFRGVINSFTDERNPRFNNQFGIDIVQLESNAVTGANNVTSGRRLDEIIGNGRDTATFQFSTDNPDEAFFGGVFSLVIDSPLLNIRKRALSDTAQRGSDVTFTIDVQNRGFVNATGVELDDPLPQGVTLVSVSDPACQNRFPCSLGTITPNQTRTVNVTFRVPPNFQGNTLSNTATATAIEDPGRRSATASVNLTAPTTAIIGDRVFNDSDNNGQQNGNEEGINGVTVELVRNGNVVATTTTATVNGVAGSYSFTGVAPGTYTVRIPTAPPQFPTLTTNNNPFNNITVNAGDQRLDIDFGFRVAPPSNADVVTTKTGPATVAPNGSITYTITARNLGPNTANNVVISDTLPQGVTFNSASDGGTFNNGVVTFGAVNIASGESITRTITVTAPASSAQPLLNVVQSSADTQDPDPNNNNGTQPPARVETTIDNPPNLPPLANDDSIGTNPGVPVNIPVLGNDSDPDNNLNPGSVTIITNPGRGTVTPNPDGTITYTPGPGFTSGTDTFEYQVCDTVGLCDRAIVSVTIPTTAPLPPVAEDRSTPPFPNTNPISVPALRGTDPDGQVVTYTITTLPTPQQGTLLLNGQPVQQGQNLTPDQVGQLVFQPNPNFTGTVTFNYTVSDNQNLTSPPATVTIPVIASPRVQIGDTVFNDINGNGVQDQGEPGLPNVTVTLTSPGSDGILGTPDDTTQTTTTNNNGNYSFPNLPPGNYRVTITPPSGFSPTTPVSQTISVTNNNPNFDFGLRQNQPQNQPPVANNTSSPSIPSGSGPVQLPTLRGTDPDGSVVSVTIPTLPPPEQGTLFLGNPGSGGVPVTPGQVIPIDQIGNLFFQPSPNFTGNVTIPFTVTDNQGAVSPPATLTIPVTAQTQPPVANNDVAGANPGQPVNINPLINDRSPDGTPLNPATLRIVSNPTNGTVQVNPDGTITYTPNPGFTSGTDTFVYEICDTRGACDTATVTVTVPAPAQLPPVATDDRASTNPNTPVAINVLDNDTDPNNNLNPTTVTIVTPPTNGTVSVNPVTGQITYTPNPGFNSGTDTFEYQVCDTSGLCDRATVTVTIPVTATNPPVANNDSTSTNPNTPVLINILANDSDPDNNLDPRTVTIISPPANGTVRVNPDGTVVYTPNPGFTNGTDIFTYQVCDSTGLCDTATVTVTVPAQLPRPPVATNDTTSTNPGTPVLINVAGNDRDPDGNLDPSTVQVINPPSNGTVRIDPATGNIIYQPNPGFNNGTDTFTYRICDTTGLCSEATVTVTVPVTTNPPPVANPDAIATNPNTPVTINVLGNDSGNLNPATLRIVTPPANGRVVINPDGTVTYIPNPGFTNGTDTFTYQICDTAGNCTEGRVTVAIPQLSPTQAEVQINLTAPTTPIAAGTNVTFNTQVTNNGPGIAQGVTLTVPLPAGVTFVSATPAQGTCVESNGNITCNLGNLNPGQTVSIPIVLRPTQPETINLTTTVTAQNEAIVNNNTATAGAVAIAGTPRVILVKRITAVTSNGTTTNFTNFVDDPTTQNDNAPGWSSLRPVGEIQPSAPLGSGDIVEYTVYFLSDGSVPAQNVNFCDAIPTDTTFISDGFAPRTGIQLNQAGTNTLLTNAQDGDVGAFFSPLSPLPNGNACAEQSNRNGSVILNLSEITNTPGSNFGFVRFRVIID
ncbi:MAG TPA: hypothetical protein DCZ55_06635 [Cyanobacteria bacterium UBA11371]|nr:hypothetical protein [Cyanobacteria bacterium UBA11371]